MKKKFYLFVLPLFFFSATHVFAKPAVKLTTVTIAAADVNQGSSSNIVYAVKMDVDVDAETINSIKFTLAGSYDNSDLSNVYIYFNATTPSLSGASYIGGSAANFAGPHTYTINISRSMPAGTSGYFIISVNVNSNATDNHTILINGATNPVIFGYNVAPNLTNSQSNKADPQTIQAADITLTTSAVAAANVNQGATGNIIYVAKVGVKTEPVVVNNITFTFSGNQKSADLTAIYLYYNASAPTLSGASYIGGTTTISDAPHTYSIGVSRQMVAGENGYYIITTNVSNLAKDEHNVNINGATNPVVFGFTTAPNVTNSQTNKADKLTIQAADITVTTVGVDSANVNQGSTGNIVYVAKMVVKTEPVVVNNITFAMGGTQKSADLTAIYLYYNASAPTLSGASYIGGTTSISDAPHTYSIGISRQMIAGETGYYIVTTNISTVAKDNHTVNINGATNPVKFGFTTDPNYTNSQTNKAQKLTIQAADITLTTSAVDAHDINQSSTGNILYVAKMNVKTEPVVVNSITFKISGSQKSGDLTAIYLYYNASAPTISGASYIGGTTSIADAPHTYSIGVSKQMIVGETGYYIITFNVSNVAKDNHNLYIDGAADPVQFGFTTVPNVTNSQTNKAKKQTIQAADVTLSTPNISSGNMAKGSTGNIIYAVKANVQTEPITVNNLTFTLSGSHKGSDLTAIYLYYNTSVSLLGASYIGGTTSLADAPHTYSINIGKAMAVGENGYFIITVNVSSGASAGKTVKISGATDPVVLGFTTDPNVTNNQSNNTGTKTIASSFIAGNSNSGDDNADAITANTLIKKPGIVYPNPANTFFKFSLQVEEKASFKIQLSTRAGSIIQEKNLAADKGLVESTFNVSAIPNGIYYLRLINKEGLMISKQQVIVQH